MTAEQYSLLCDLFERFSQGNFNTEYNPETDILHTSPQARKFSIRVLEIMNTEVTL